MHNLYECEFHDLHAIHTDPAFDEYFERSGYVPLTFPVSNDDEDKHDLSPDCGSASCDTSTTLTHCSQDDNSISSADSSDDYMVHALSDYVPSCSAGPLVDLLQDPDLVPTVPPLLSHVAAGARAYHGLEPQLASLGISRSDFYREIRATESLLNPSTSARAHLDGGAQVSTSHQYL